MAKVDVILLFVIEFLPRRKKRRNKRMMKLWL